MRKELSVYIKTSDDDEISLNSTNSGVVVLTLPNGIKVGLNPKELRDAIFEIEFFKSFEKTKDYTIISTTHGSQIDLGEVWIHYLKIL